MAYKSGAASFVVLMVLFAHSVLAADYRIAKALSVPQQQIKLTITPGERTFSGETKLTYRLSQPIDYIAYHALGLTLEQVELAYQGKQLSLPVVAADEFDIVRHDLPFTLEESAELTIRFTGLVGKVGSVQGLYEVGGDGDQTTLFTQFQEMEARRVFPALDDPGIKTTFTLTLDIPAGLQALHNTRPVKTQQQGSRQLIRFASTPKINTDVLALAVGEFNATELKGAGVPATAYMPKNVRQSVPAELGTLIHQSISYLSDYLDSPFPYSRLDFFIAPIGTLAGMENVSLIALNTNQLPGADASQGELCRFRKLIAHEVAHTWFGHNVTMQWYDDYWLNESFSEFFAAKAVAHYYPDNNACTYTPQIRAFDGDNHSAPALQRIVRDRTDNEGIGGLYYTKGRALLNMLEAHVGDATFKQVMRQYVEAHQGGHATTADFSGLFPKSLRVDEIVNSYLTQPGYPLITLSKQNDKLVLSQQSFHDDTGRRWTTPLQLKLWDGHRIRTQRLILSEAAMSLPQVGAQDAILIDPAGVGYFRHIDRSANPRFPVDQRTMADRLADMDNQEALTKTGLLGYTHYIQGLIELLRTQPADSLEVSKALDILKDAFVAQVPAHLQPQFVGFLAQRLPKQRPWQALITQSTGGSWLELYGLYLKSPEAIGFARKYAASRPLAQLQHRASVLRVLAKNSSNDEYQDLLKLFSTDSRPIQEDLLDSLGYVANAQQVSLFYDFLLSEATRSFVIDYRFQFPAFQPRLRPVAARYMQQHKAQIQARIPDDQLQWFPYNFITGCSEQDTALLRRTFADWLTVAGLEKKLAIVEEHIRSCHRDTRKARDDIAAM